jgi:hypothetical protein
VHARSSPATFILQMRLSVRATDARACPRVLDLVYPSRTRGVLSLCKTDNGAMGPLAAMCRRLGAHECGLFRARGGDRALHEVGLDRRQVRRAGAQLAARSSCACVGSRRAAFSTSTGIQLTSSPVHTKSPDLSGGAHRPARADRTGDRGVARHRAGGRRPACRGRRACRGPLPVDREGAQATVDAIASFGEGHAVSADLTDATAIQAMFAPSASFLVAERWRFLGEGQTASF